MATSPVPSLAARNALPKSALGRGRLLRPLMGVLVLLSVAAASAATTWLWVSRAHLANPTDTTVAGELSPAPIVPPAAPIFLPLDAFTVSLQSRDLERILHVRMTLRVNDDVTRERLERYMPEVRSRVLIALSAQSPDAVSSTQGKAELADAVRNALQTPFAPLTERQAIRDVLFTEFVVQ